MKLNDLSLAAKQCHNALPGYIFGCSTEFGLRLDCGEYYITARFLEKDQTTMDITICGDTPLEDVFRDIDRGLRATDMGAIRLHTEPHKINIIRFNWCGRLDWLRPRDIAIARDVLNAIAKVAEELRTSRISHDAWHTSEARAVDLRNGFCDVEALECEKWWLQR